MTKTRNYALVFWIACTAVLTPSLATAGMADRVVAASGNGTFESAVSALSGAEVKAEKGSSNVSIKASTVSSFTESLVSADTGTAYFSVWSLTASAPLNKNGDESEVANLDGLVNAASVELKYSRFQVPGKRNPMKSPGTMQKLDDICKRAFEEQKKRTGKDPDPAQACDSNLIANYGTETDQYAFESAFWDLDKEADRLIYGGNVKVGHQNFEFIDSASVSKMKEDETPWSIGAFVAYNPEAWRTIFILSVQYQDAFKESASGAVCPAPDGSGSPLNCLTGPVGKPKETRKKLVSLETRKDFGFVAVGLTPTYDFEERVWGVELPVYFVKDKDGKFSAGLKGGWRSDTHDVTAGVFVSTAFGLLN